MKRIFFITVLLFSYTLAFGQGIQYYNETFITEKFKKKSPPKYFSLQKKSNEGMIEEFFLYSDSTLIKKKITYSEIGGLDFHEKTFYFDNRGQLAREVNYNKNDSIRVLKVYNHNGNLVRKTDFLNSKIIFEENYDDNGIKIEKTTELLPEPYQGVKAWNLYLLKNLRYPKEARAESAKGKVLIFFTVSEIGKINNIEILNQSEIHFALAQEAYKLMNNYPHDWNPYILNGQPMEKEVIVPLVFNGIVFR